MKFRFLKKHIALLLALIVLHTLNGFNYKPLNAADLGTSYYIDSTSSSLKEEGTMENPYKSLVQINTKTLSAGDNVFIKAGTNYTGQLVIKGSGTETNPIIVGSYGSGPKPQINGNGLSGQGVLYIYNSSYLEVSNLEIYNSATSEGDRRGVLIEGNNAGVLSNIHVKDLYIHDIKGYLDAANNGMSMESKKTGGIQAWTSHTSTPTRFDNLVIESCTITNVDNAGISLFASAKTTDPNWEQTKYTNLRVINNTINNIGKNAIIVRSTDNTCLAEGNVFYDTAMRCVSGNQLFTANCVGTIIQKNEGYLNRAIADSKGAIRDGSMLDPDLRSNGTIWQYNYSHDNAFGLMTNCTVSTDDNVIVRYNISVADKGWLMNLNYDVKGMYIYNNTFYVPSDLSPVIIRERDKSFSDRDTNQTYYYYNNIVYNESTTATFDFALPTDSKSDSKIYKTVHRNFSNNIIYNKNGGKLDDQYVLNDTRYCNQTDMSLLTSDPMFIAPSAGKNLADRTGRNTLEGFKLKIGSPALASGKNISNNGGYDFFGNVLPSNTSPNRGAYGGEGVVLSTPSPTVEKFNDIESVVWAKKEINILANKDIIYGTSQNAFSPGNNITRGDFIAFLVKTLNLKATFEENFEDALKSAPYFNELGIAKKLGIAGGVGNNMFNPEEQITRQDLMVLTVRAMNYAKKIDITASIKDIEQYTDKSEIREYAVESVAMLVKKGLVKGNGELLNPLGNATRAETAVIMYRIFND